MDSRLVAQSGVTQATLFRDFDGLARSTAYEPEVVSGRLVR